MINKEKTDRLPMIVELVIPSGTALKVASGEEVASIPDEMIFVIGDTLSITNEDNVSHEFGPLYIPAGTSASLVMEDANKYTLGCSFKPSRFFNFDVRSRTTLKSRFTALFLATPPTTVFLFLYSLLIFPITNIQEELESGTNND